MKHLSKFALAAACALSLAACDKDNDPEMPDPDVPTVTEGAFVLNQGNYYKLIEGSLTLIDYNAQESVQNVFQAANGRSLGATPQGAVVYGSKIYIGVYESNVIEIIDRVTFKSVKQISLEKEEGQSPRSLVAKDGKVYVSMFNGYVSRLDTLSLSIDKTVKVGPNPEIMAIKDNTLYVPNSDGLNYQVGYGTTASKIDLAAFAVTETFEVGLNPAEFASNGTDLFLLCKGNYGDIPSTIYRIADDGKSTKVAEATMMTLRGNSLYYINAPYGDPNPTYEVYDTATGSVRTMVKAGVDSPAALGVDPLNGNIIITSYKLDNGYADYMSDGYANVYDASGTLLRRYDVGVSPCAIFFNYK